MNILKYQIVRFCIIGSINAVIDYFILNLFYIVFDMPLFWATFFGFIAGGVTGYFLHSRFCFFYKNKLKIEIIKFTNFLFVSIISLTITEIIMNVLTKNLGVYYNYSKAVAIIFVAAWSFSAMKWWIFKR